VSLDGGRHTIVSIESRTTMDRMAIVRPAVAATIRLRAFSAGASLTQNRTSDVVVVRMMQEESA